MKKKIIVSAFIIAMLATPFALRSDDIMTESAIDQISTTKAYGNVETLTNFAEQTSEGYVVLDFYTTWCHYCKLLNPVLTQMAGRYLNIRFIKINAETHRSIASQFGVRGFPTLILLKDGKEVKRNAGFMNAGKFAAWLNPYADA